MSPRAAWRLERLGFDVYDYEAGKADWLAAGLSSVRGETAGPRAIDVADRTPPTCPPDALVSDLTEAVIVVNEQGVVLGRVRPGDHPATAVAEDVIDPGPTTVRANEPLDELLERMVRRHVHEVIVSTPEGRLLGVVRQP